MRETAHHRAYGLGVDLQHLLLYFFGVNALTASDTRKERRNPSGFPCSFGSLFLPRRFGHFLLPISVEHVARIV